MFAEPTFLLIHGRNGRKRIGFNHKLPDSEYFSFYFFRWVEHLYLKKMYLYEACKVVVVISMRETMTSEIFFSLSRPRSEYRLRLVCPRVEFFLILLGWVSSLNYQQIIYRSWKLWAAVHTLIFSNKIICAVYDRFSSLWALFRLALSSISFNFFLPEFVLFLWFL